MKEEVLFKDVIVILLMAVLILIAIPLILGVGVASFMHSEGALYFGYIGATIFIYWIVAGLVLYYW